jgi:hypothetical protein
LLKPRSALVGHAGHLQRAIPGDFPHIPGSNFPIGSRRRHRALFKSGFANGEKNRRKRTPVMFKCVGLLVTGFSGDWPDYPLFSHPRTSIFCRELVSFKAPLLTLNERSSKPAKQAQPEAVAFEIGSSSISSTRNAAYRPKIIHEVFRVESQVNRCTLHYFSFATTRLTSSTAERASAAASSTIRFVASALWSASRFAVLIGSSAG